jgi:hypothetical protein
MNIRKIDENVIGLLKGTFYEVLFLEEGSTQVTKVNHPKPFYCQADRSVWFRKV